MDNKDREKLANSGHSAPVDDDTRIKITGYWVLVATILGASMAYIDGTAVNVMLPALQSEWGATLIDVEWVVESYALFLAALLLVGGVLGDVMGRRKIYTVGIVVFTISSVLCGISANVNQLIIFRGIQGVGAAMLIPGSLSIITAYFPVSRRGRAIGIWSAFSAITTALGPVFGGWLIDNVSWRWVFFINIPIAVVVVILLYLKVPESRDEESGGTIDIKGAVLATLGLGGVVYGLIESSVAGFESLRVLIPLIGGASALFLFIYNESVSDKPMLPVGMFRSVTFTGANVITLFLYAALGGALFFLPFDLIQVHGYTATEAGASLMPVIVMMFILSSYVGTLSDRYGNKPLLIVGPAFCAAAYVLLAVFGKGGSYWYTFFPGMTVLGIGIAFSVTPLTAAVMSSVQVKNAGIASGVNNAVSRIGGLLAVAAFGIVVVSIFNTNLQKMFARHGIPEYVQELFGNEKLMLAGAAIPAELDEATRVILESAVHASYVMSLEVILYIAAGLCLLCSFIAWGTIRD